MNPSILIIIFFLDDTLGAHWNKIKVNGPHFASAGTS